MKTLLNTFILLLAPSAAFAQTTSNPESGFMSFMPLILIFVIFYFLLIRPQQKKAKEHQNMVNSLKIGNEVCTASGIFGKVKKIDDKEKMVDLEIADGVIIKILKASINQVLDSKKLTNLKNSKVTPSNKKKSKK